MKRLNIIILLMLMATSLASAQKVISLWPNGAPYNSSDAEDKAELTVFLPDQKKATGRAIVCCPGGAYSHLAMQHEGTDWQWFFNNQGIALIVLKYRTPHGNFKVPISDAEEAMKTVRRHAKEWNINPKDVGIMGFSAGGHLASTIATHSKGEAKPDFQVLFYPVITMVSGFTHKGSHDNFMGKELTKKQQKKMEQEYSSDMQVSRATPRAFIALSDDDQGVMPSNGVNYYLECYRHDVPAALHVYPTGGHGWGYRESFPYHMEMLLELKAWLATF